LQISLFTRLSIAEAELRAIKDTLAELKVNHDELRRDRDEWRWRAERLRRTSNGAFGGGGVNGPMQRSTP
jgi:chromosome segregation ATPase